jgi:hypothetical protein
MMASLDGWSLDQKITRIHEEINSEIKELKMNFALLYDYIKKMETSQSPEIKKKKDKTKN